MTVKSHEMTAQLPTTAHFDISSGFYSSQESALPTQLEYLQNRVTSLETRLQQAIASSVKKDDYVNKLTIDLEHIIMQLQRLQVVKQQNQQS